VEFSTNGRQWSSIGNIRIVNSNRGNYNFPHVNIPVGILYYRIRQTDNDGSFIYSRTVVLNNQKNGSAYTIYPNPADQTIGIALPASVKGTTEIELFDAIGRKLAGQRSTGNSVELPTSYLPNGNYVLRISNNGTVYTQKVMIMHP